MRQRVSTGRRGGAERPAAARAHATRAEPDIVRLQRAAGNRTVSALVRRREGAAPGQPLDGGTRAAMEERLGQPLGAVRVHADAGAARSADALDAVAYTKGEDIVFGAGAYDPASPRGRRLLAHELAHVVQQRAGVAPEGLSQPGDRGERQADAAAEAVGRGERGVLAGLPQGAAPAAGGAIQRQAKFESLGPGVQADTGAAEKITRPEQVLSEYGMTCYGTSVLYIVQSYGLVPPDMTREEFEYAFSPLNPHDPGKAKSGDIKVAGKEIAGAAPVDLVTEALQGTPTPSRSRTSLGLVTSTEATLRGADQGSFTVANIMEHMPRILAAFDRQSAVKGYEFMGAHRAPAGRYVPAKSEHWVEAAAELEKGAIGADYFAGGNTVMTGVDYSWPPEVRLGHWVVIVKEPEEVEVAGRTYHLYPADDPLFGQAYVMAPMLRKATDEQLEDADLKRKYGYLTYDGVRVLMLYPGHAYRRKIPATAPRAPSSALTPGR